MKRGFTAVELLVAMGIFGLLSLIALAALNLSMRTWFSTSSRNLATNQLVRAAQALERDGVRTSINDLRVGQGPASLGAGRDGDAVWFLSATDPSSGEQLRGHDGAPFWEHQILYYLVVPDQLDQVAGYSIAGGQDADGYEDRCPFKVLIRKEIALGATADPDNDATEQALLANPSQYLTRPRGYQIDFMLAEPGVRSVELVAHHLLTFRCATGVNHAQEIEFDLRAVRIEEAERSLGIGPTSLSDGEFTERQLLSVRARN